MQDVNSKLSSEYDEVLTELGVAEQNVFLLQQRLQVCITYIQHAINGIMAFVYIAVSLWFWYAGGKKRAARCKFKVVFGI